MDLSYREYFASPSIFIENVLQYNTALEACLESEEEARIIDSLELVMMLQVSNDMIQKLIS